jgi:hypothetical protein
MPAGLAPSASKKVNGTYRSGPCRKWIKVRNPASIAVQRERSELWNRWTAQQRAPDKLMALTR